MIEGEEPHHEPGREHLPHCPPHCHKEPPFGHKFPVPPPKEECPPECKPEICIIVIEGEEPHHEPGREHLPHCPKHCEKWQQGGSSPGGYGPPPPQGDGGYSPVPRPGGGDPPAGRPNVVPVSGATERGYGGVYLGVAAIFVAAVWF